MLRLNRLTDYAVMIMAFMACYPKQAMNAKKIAEHTRVSLPTTSKLLKHLTRNHLLIAHRGTKGGYQLALPASSIPIGRIISALEGQIALTQCSHTKHRCYIQEHCIVRDNWRKLSAQIKDTLSHISLADMRQPFELELQFKEPLC